MGEKVLGYETVIDLGLESPEGRKTLIMELAGILYDSMPSAPTRAIIAFDTAIAPDYAGGYKVVVIDKGPE